MELNFGRIEVLLLIAAIVAMVVRKFHLPYTVGLTIAGAALAFAPLSSELKLTKELIFTAFLPPLIFEAAFNMQWRELRRDAGIIATLATFGVVLAAGVTTLGLHYGVGWPWASSVLLGLLISATDPVSVIATFKEAGVTGRLRLLVESESLFNDGTVAVLYGVALAAASGGTISAGGATGNFFWVVAGGVLCGLGVGGAVLLLAGRTEDHLVELTFSTVAAYGSFLMAEHFHLSGVLATLTAGVLIGNTGHMGAFSDRGRNAVAAFWEYAGFVANSLIFLLIGMRLVAQHVFGVLPVASLVVALVLIGRAIAVYGSCALFAGSHQRVSPKHQHILVWGGLRGALALALALGLPETVPLNDQIVSVAFAVVAFSLVVQGVTMTPFLRRMGEIGSAAEGK
ncbi:MAG: sodium:proton antiporter [Opitutaceae bacterium]